MSTFMEGITRCEVLDGFRFDTRNAEELGRVNRWYLRADYPRWKAALFRTKNGNHFISGVGSSTTTIRDALANVGITIVPKAQGIFPVAPIDAAAFLNAFVGQEHAHACFPDLVMPIEDA